MVQPEPTPLQIARERPRAAAAAAGDRRAGDRAGRLHPARARRIARPGAPARRRRRSAPHHRGDERGGATGQPLPVVAAFGQCRRGHPDRHRPGGDRDPERGAVGHPGDAAALHPLSRHRHRRLLSAGARHRGRPRLDAAGVYGAVVRRDRADRRQCDRALALCRQHRPVLGGGDYRGDILDLALGADRTCCCRPRSPPACWFSAGTCRSCVFSM